MKVYITVSEFGTASASSFAPNSEYIGEVLIGTVEVDVPEFSQDECIAAAIAARKESQLEKARKALAKLESAA